MISETTFKCQWYKTLAGEAARQYLFHANQKNTAAGILETASVNGVMSYFADRLVHLDKERKRAANRHTYYLYMQAFMLLGNIVGDFVPPYHDVEHPLKPVAQ